MNKFIVYLAICLASSLSINAADIMGTVKEFSGLSIETNRPYSYIALATLDGQRIRLPSWIDGAELLKNQETSKFFFDAEGVRPLYNV